MKYLTILFFSLITLIVEANNIKIELYNSAVYIYKNKYEPNNIFFHQIPYIPGLKLSYSIKKNSMISIGFNHYSSNNLKPFSSTGTGTLSKNGYFFNFYYSYIVKLNKRFELPLNLGTSINFLNDSRFVKPIGFQHSVQDNTFTKVNFGAIFYGLGLTYRISNKFYLSSGLNIINFFDKNKYQRNTGFYNIGIGIKL